jgi:hypothetical protein
MKWTDQAGLVHAVRRENFNAKAPRRHDAKRILRLQNQVTKRRVLFSESIPLFPFAVPYPRTAHFWQNFSSLFSLFAPVQDLWLRVCRAAPQLCGFALRPHCIVPA